MFSKLFKDTLLNYSTIFPNSSIYSFDKQTNKFYIINSFYNDEKNELSSTISENDKNFMIENYNEIYRKIIPAIDSMPNINYIIFFPSHIFKMPVYDAFNWFNEIINENHIFHCINLSDGNSIVTTASLSYLNDIPLINKES